MSDETRDVEEFIIEALSWAETLADGRLGHERAEGMLAEHDARVRAEERERIALAIEAQGAIWHETYGSNAWPPTPVVTEGYARIARKGGAL